MIFVNEGYESYDNLVEIGDNYVVLSNRGSVNGTWQEPDEINVIYQYFKPSTQTIRTTRTFTDSRSFESIDITDDFYYRGDCCEIMTIGIIMTFFFIFILNGLTRIGKKGGIFFGQ